MSSKPVFLDVDSSIVERNLKITDDDGEDFNKMFNLPDEQFPSKVIKPAPGFCIKTKEIGTETKIFINICKTDGLPPPKTISEEELREILSTDEITGYKVPMSIGDLRTNTDKKGEEAKVCDVAINDKFFETVENSQLFKNFLMAIVFEGLSNKHSIFPTDDRILLKNKKAFGKLQTHRIQQREVEQKMGQQKPEPLIKEIGGYESSKWKPSIETLTEDVTETKTPEHRLFKKFDNPNVFYAEIKLPYIVSSEELTLDVGEDRIMLESKAKRYLLDIFLPVHIIQDGITSKFNKDTKILTITMPIQEI